MKLLEQILSVLKKKPKSGRIYKADKIASIQLRSGDFKVWHTPADDIESLFYVLIWIMVLYDGLLGRERQDFDFESSILGKWNEGVIKNLWVARNSKVAFVLESSPEVLEACVSSYFCDLIPLTQDWREAFRESYGSRDGVNIDKLLEKTETFLSHMPPENPPEVENEYLTRQAEKNALQEASQHLCPPGKCTIPQGAGKKHICDDMVWSAGDLPISSLAKHTKIMA